VYHIAMASEPITIMVDPETAKVYREATPQSRQKMELLFELGARRVEGEEQKPLEQRRREFLETLHEVQAMAAANGLTPEILDEILGEE
jgi:hypothetical protein